MTPKNKFVIDNRKFTKQLILFAILSLIIISLYGFVHETAHFIACKSIGSDAKITINLLQSPPLYLTTCPQAINFSKGELFITRSAPYLLSAIIMISLAIFFRTSKLFYLALPSGIFLSDWFNILNLFNLNLLPLTASNDFLQVFALTNKFYFFLMVLLTTITLVSYLFIWFKNIIPIVKNLEKN